MKDAIRALIKTYRDMANENDADPIAQTILKQVADDLEKVLEEWTL